MADAMLSDSNTSIRHVREIDARVNRGLIRLDRGDDAGADQDSAVAFEFVQGSPDPQLLFPVLACRARVLVEIGRQEEAAPLIDDLLARWTSNPFTFASSWLAYAAPPIVALGRQKDLARAARKAPLQTLWLEAALALADDPLGSATTYARIGSLTHEAHARLQGAELLAAAGRRDEARAELEPALEFFTRVGATRYVRAAEALLAKAP
jgi:hypothetical protein